MKGLCFSIGSHGTLNVGRKGFADSSLVTIVIQCSPISREHASNLWSFSQIVKVIHLLSGFNI